MRAIIPVYDFFRTFNEDDERFVSIDDLPDFRSDVEKVHTPLAIYNHARPDLAFAERLAEESINISGAPVKLFIKEPYIDNEDLESPWDEDADPVYRPGVTIKAWFKVDSLNVELTRWGVDSPLQITVVFARAVLGKEVGFNQLVSIHDVIQVPYNAPKLRGPARFRVINAYDSGMFQYRWLYYTAICELITGDDSVKVTHQISSQPDNGRFI